MNRDWMYWSVQHSVTLDISAILRIYVIVREAQTWIGQSPFLTCEQIAK